MPRRALAAAALAALAVLAGCGEEPPKTPVACLGETRAYEEGLRSAPERVRLDGRTAISDCLHEEQDAGAIAQVGESLIVVATKLNEAGRTRAGDGRPALEAGYLIGAVSVAVAKSGGIHDDLLRRLEAAVVFEDGKPLPPSYRRAYATGYAAGRRHG